MKKEPAFDPDFPELASPPVSRHRGGGRWLAVVALLLVAAGGALGWKMLGPRPAAAGGDLGREMMRAELMNLSAAESAYVRTNGRYAASVPELGMPITSRVVVFASAGDGYRVRLARPETPQLCELSLGRFAAGHAGWQLLCGVPAANNTLVEPEAPKPSLLDRIRAALHEDCDSECRVKKLREGLKSPERKQLDQALDAL